MGLHLAILWAYSWVYTQETLLAVLRVPYGTLEIEPWPVTYRANALPNVLVLILFTSRIKFWGIMGFMPLFIDPKGLISGSEALI